jgi:hypothetical protein
MKKHRTIYFEKNTVTKLSEPALMRVEVEKTRRAHKIGKDCGLFRVPEIIDYDELKGKVVFERIKNIHPVRPALYDINKNKHIIECIGSSLAIIHHNLSLPQNIIIPLPSELNLSGSEVFLHGDFNCVNVCKDNGSQSIIILDWQMTSVFGGQATFGTRYFDLLFFISSLYNRPTLRHLFSDPVHPVARDYLDAYFKESGIEYDSNNFSLYAKKFFILVKMWFNNNAGWRHRPLLFRSNAMIKNFVHNIPSLL